MSKISEEFDWDNKTWDVIDKFFKQDNILIDHHLTSFNYFMNNELQSIIRRKEFNPLKIFNKNSWNDELQLYTETYQIEFGKIYISKPVLYDNPNNQLVFVLTLPFLLFWILFLPIIFFYLFRIRKSINIFIYIFISINTYL